MAVCEATPHELLYTSVHMSNGMRSDFITNFSDKRQLQGCNKTQKKYCRLPGSRREAGRTCSAPVPRAEPRIHSTPRTHLQLV